MKRILTAGLVLLLCTAAYAQKSPKLPQQLFRRLMTDPGNFPQQSISKLSDKQLSTLIRTLEQANASLVKKNLQERKRQENVFKTARPALLRVLSGQEMHSLSGTLFKTKHQGKTEVFGAVPMHVLKHAQEVPGTVSKQFSVAVETPQGTKIVPVEVVQLSSTKTVDVALIKFRPQDEALLSPLELGKETTSFPTQVYAQGFARSILSQQSFSLIGNTSIGIYLAQIPSTARGERAGFCGSPVLTKQATLAGIHIGSSYLEQQDPQQRAFFAAFQLTPPAVEQGDIGYITPARFLQQLVDTYHNPAYRPIVIKLAGQEITRLAIDEYVASIELFDKDMKSLWKKETDFKQTFTAAETVLRLYPQAVFVGMQIGKSSWKRNKTEWFVKDEEKTSYVLRGLQR